MNHSTFKFPNYPYYIGWAITNKCNLRCLHCNMSSGSENKNELTTSEAKEFIDEIALNKASYILFTGGEPLLRKDFFEISSYATKKGIKIGVTTNGTLVNEHIAMNELCKFQLVRVSLDGSTAKIHDHLRNQAGVYDSALKSIKLLCNLGIKTSVVTAVSHLNLNDLPNLASLLIELGVSTWCISLFAPSGRGENIKEVMLNAEEVKNLILLLTKFKNDLGLRISTDLPYSVLLSDPNSVTQNSKQVSYCPAGITQVMIFSDGNISPCFDLPLICGNVRNGGLKDAWNDSKVFQTLRNKEAIKGKCAECELLYTCGGGCRAIPYILSGDYLGDDILCWK